MLAVIPLDQWKFKWKIGAKLIRNISYVFYRTERQTKINSSQVAYSCKNYRRNIFKWILIHNYTHKRENKMKNQYHTIQRFDMCSK